MSIPALNQKVLAFCVQHNGSRVGDGECWTLVERALADAGAGTSTQIMGSRAVGRPNADYRWGTVVRLSGAQPGDIIQYRAFAGTVRTTRPSGSWNESSYSLPHHTAVIRQTFPNGKVSVWEQNVGRHYSSLNPQIVLSNTLHLLTTNYTATNGDQIRVRITGRFRIFRPAPPPAPPAPRRRRRSARRRRPRP